MFLISQLFQQGDIRSPVARVALLDHAVKGYDVRIRAQLSGIDLRQLADRYFLPVRDIDDVLRSVIGKDQFDRTYNIGDMNEISRLLAGSEQFDSSGVLIFLDIPQQLLAQSVAVSRKNTDAADAIAVNPVVILAELLRHVLVQPIGGHRRRSV